MFRFSFSNYIHMLRSFQNENKYYSYIDLGSPIGIHAHVYVWVQTRDIRKRHFFYVRCIASHREPSFSI